MSWRGLQAAKVFGQRLPVFTSQADAEACLFGKRDERIHRITMLAAASGVLDANFAPASLKNLESWYFVLCDTNGFGYLASRVRSLSVAWRVIFAK
jgi:hypothetical protein